MKNVTISDELYENLALMKQPGESFSDVINRLVHRRKVKLKTFYGSLRESKFLDELESEVERVRKESRGREF
ncbi:MAG: antitoxin VapB family protein [Candidatus Thermoplasmatota archaeon]|nr:antitoxin VapB family protein [Candidatus Thermoplasmatota archaeon]